MKPTLSSLISASPFSKLSGIIAAGTFVFGAIQADAAITTITSLNAHTGNGATNGNSGKLTQFTGGLIGGSASSGTSSTPTGVFQPDANDPSTWIHDRSWQENWQTGRLSGGGNIGWVVLGFNSTTELDQLYLWNVKESGAPSAAQTRGVQTFNIWYINTPTTTATGTGNYNFSAGGWTQLGSTYTLSIGGNTGEENGVFDLSGIPSATYLAIEILSNYGSDNTTSPDPATGGGGNNRVGLAEIVITQVPEPTSALLISISALGLLRRRRIH